MIDLVEDVFDSDEGKAKDFLYQNYVNGIIDHPNFTIFVTGKVNQECTATRLLSGITTDKVKSPLSPRRTFLSSSLAPVSRVLRLHGRAERGTARASREHIR